MGILGNPIITSSFVVDYLSGNAVTTSFVLSVSPAGVNSIAVMLSGIQESPANYSLNGTSLIFAVAPPTGTNNIVVRHLGIRGTTNAVAASAITATELATNAVTTTKVLDAAITPAKLSAGAPTWDTLGTLTTGRSISVGTGVSTGTASIELGGERTGDGPSFIDFHSRAGSDNDSRIIRNSGVNGELEIRNVGTGDLSLCTNNIERFKIDSVGQISANIASTVGTSYDTLYKGYLARAWVNFNGSGTPAIRASGNCSSITDIGVGNYGINLTTAMPDVNYSVVASSLDNGSAAGSLAIISSAPTASSFGLITVTPNTITAVDSVTICASVHR